MENVTGRVQIHAPIQMLQDEYLPLFIKHGLNPEIAVDAVALDRFTPMEYQKIADEFQASNRTITLHAPFMGLSPGSSDPGIRTITKKRLNQTLALVSIFKPLSVVCHSGFDAWHVGSDKKKWLEQSLEIWQWFAGEITTRGSRLMMENVHERNPDELRMLLHPLKDLGVGWCLDVGHHFAFGQGSLREWFDILLPYLGQIHLHDNMGSGDDHLALGKGKINFPWLLGELARWGISPIMTIEAHNEADIWESLSYLEENWGKSKTDSGS